MKEIAYDVLEKYPELPPNIHWGEVSCCCNELRSINIEFF